MCRMKRDAGAAEANFAIDVTKSDAQANLSANGYSIFSSSNSATVLSNGQNFYTLFARGSTGGQGLSFNNLTTKDIIKYSLSGP
jgi:hypothetical protein